MRTALVSNIKRRSSLPLAPLMNRIFFSPQFVQLGDSQKINRHIFFIRYLHSNLSQFIRSQKNKSEKSKKGNMLSFADPIHNVEDVFRRNYGGINR